MQPISKPISFREGQGYLHGFSTGTVKVKRGFQETPVGPLLAKPHFLMQSSFTSAMPIWVWVIEHPEGIFLVDTGEHARINDTGYFDEIPALLRYINQQSFRFEVKPEEEVLPQLRRLGIQVSDLHQLVLSHLHIDHVDGLEALTQVETLIHDYEWQNPGFALTQLFPSGFTPKQVTITESGGHPFGGSYPLTESGEIQLVPTPGHTKGHCSVLIQTNFLHYLLAGDTSYTQAQVLDSKMSGAHTDFTAARRTFKLIRQYAMQHPLVYLPSHDSEATMRIQEDRLLLGT